MPALRLFNFRSTFFETALLFLELISLVVVHCIKCFKRGFQVISPQLDILGQLSE